MKHGNARVSPRSSTCLQIPAFLCRQTDLIIAAAKTGRPVNIKKGPFLAPWDMIHAVEKAREAGAAGVLVTERGTSFGYNTLVADMRALPILKGDRRARRFRRDACRAAAGRTRRVVGRRAAFCCNARPRRGGAVGVAALFIETHPDPGAAISDGATQIPLGELEAMVKELMAFDRLAKTPV